MAKEKRSNQKGFTLLLVIFIMSVGTLVLMSILDVISVDFGIVGDQRAWVEADNNAEVAMLEVIANNNTQNDIRLVHNEGDLTFDYVDCSSVPCKRNLFGGGQEDLTAANSLALNAVGNSYESTITYLRTTDAPGSSQGRVRRVVYEVAVKSSVRGGDAEAAMRAQVSTLVSGEGSVLPRMHGR